MNFKMLNELHKSCFGKLKVYISICLIFFLVISFVSTIYAQDRETYISNKREAGSFMIADNGQSASVVLDGTDFKGIATVTQWFMNDLEMVTGQKTTLFQSELPKSENVILVGTIGKNRFIDKLVSEGKLDVSDLKGKWECSLTQIVENPFPGIENALVLAGSDKRGTMYAILDLSKAMGVSPWYWWADVPVKHQQTVYVKPGRYITESPKVKYRGIFLNDEEPALGGWVRENFGGFNHQFYEKVFELILRLRGNFLWPAMWGKAFYDDDLQNGTSADRLGIVIGTSHHEPMGRAHDEWRRYGKGVWDYSKNPVELNKFWTQGVQRIKNYETLVTVGMRGDGDEPMSEESNIQLLEKIINDQREIIKKITNKKIAQTPQVWALYKEVQDYYDKGMRVPDDVTLLLSDDNWGDVRKLPAVDAPKRAGGYGMYYHLDYVGGPRNYKWINVSQIQRIWEQMNLTYSHGVDRIWVVNVGDLKPMEFPINFFLDMAWDSDRFNPDNLLQYTEQWCAEQFGRKFAKESARIINLYTKYNSRVTPELLNDSVYSLLNYNEFQHVTDDYKTLALDAFRLYQQIPEPVKDAFYQLVLFPVDASSNLYEMYFAQAKNKELAGKNNPEANFWADKVKECFDRDSLLTVRYNHEMSNGKWNHMMDQIRIGYTYWQQPQHRVMPEIIYVTDVDNSRRIFTESDGYVSIEAPHYNRAVGTTLINWKIIPCLGKTLSGVSTFPQNAYPRKQDKVYLEYDVWMKSEGVFNVYVLISPTLNFNANKGLRYALSVNGKEEKEVNINSEYSIRQMEKWQADRINETTTGHEFKKGLNTVRFRVLEPGIVLQKIMIDAGGLKPSFLGAPESERKIE